MNYTKLIDDIIQKYSCKLDIVYYDYILNNACLKIINQSNHHSSMKILKSILAGHHGKSIL